MAQLIKLNQRPRKFHLKQKLRFVPLNRWLYLKDLHQKKAELDLLEQRMALVRALVQNYDRFDAQEAFRQGFRNHRIKLIIDCLEYFLRLEKTLHLESLAIDHLASKIAQNILARPLKPHEKIKDTLKNPFSLSILISKDEVDILNKDFRVISQLLNQKQLFFETEGPALLKMVIFETSLEIELPKADIDEILKAVEGLLQ